MNPDSQPLFVFTWEDQQYLWTQLPQGYTESPSLFSQILKMDLSISLPWEMTLIQCVDGLLLASLTEDDCCTDTHHLLSCLAERRHKASPIKLQYLKQEVICLICPGIHKLAPVHIKTILGMKPPIMKHSWECSIFKNLLPVICRSCKKTSKRRGEPIWWILVLTKGKKVQNHNPAEARFPISSCKVYYK